MIFRGAMSNDALWKILRKFENQKWKLKNENSMIYHFAHVVFGHRRGYSYEA
jgi:hypothetical protein